MFKKSFVCKPCFYIPQPQSRREGELSHEYLFNYDSYSEVFIKNFKYGAFANVVNQVSFRFAPDDVCVIVMPNSKNLRGQENHSYVLAKAIFSEVEIHEPFEKISDKQACKSKGERQRVRMRSIQSIDTQNKQVVFVDDLLTTGSTIRKAWEILGKPNARIITLCYTPKKQETICHR